MSQPSPSEASPNAPRPEPAAPAPGEAPPAAKPRRPRLPLVVGAALWVALIGLRPGLGSVLLGGLCFVLAWAWLASPVGRVPGRRNPHLREVARRPRVTALRGRAFWIPRRRVPGLWALVLGGLLVLGVGVGLVAGADSAGLVWWALFTPAMVLAAALVLDALLLMTLGYWIVAVPLLAMVAVVPFVVEGAGRPMVIGLVALLAGLWFADLARALYQVDA